MTGEFSLDELAAAVQAWAERNGVYPANGQASGEITERTIRYYRTIGLLDPPAGSYAKTFSEKHKLQLIAIRLYQWQGLPLRRIREELYGQSLEDLRALEKRAVKKAGGAGPFSIPFLAPTGSESWSVVPLAGDFLLVSRNHEQLPQAVLEKIRQLISSVNRNSETAAPTKRN